MKRPEIAIIGCGAVVQLGYLPSLASFPDLNITWLVDLNLDEARDAAGRFGVPNHTDDYRRILDKVDGVLIATPPASHAAIAAECFAHGVHVLCEKPMATSSAEALAMVQGAKDHGVHFGVVRNLRLAASSQLTKRFVERALGPLQRFEATKGQKFQWPAKSSYRTQPSSTGGGVLADAGPHVFDLLFWYVGGTARVVKHTDDNLGGVEANARTELVFETDDAREVAGWVDVSFTRTLENTLKIYGERGWLETSTGGGATAMFYPDPESRDEGVELRFADGHPYATDWKDQMGGQLRVFADSIVGEQVHYVPASEAVQMMRLLEDCAASRQTKLRPWEAKYLVAAHV